MTPAMGHRLKSNPGSYNEDLSRQTPALPVALSVQPLLAADFIWVEMKTEQEKGCFLKVFWMKWLVLPCQAPFCVHMHAKWGIATVANKMKEKLVEDGRSLTQMIILPLTWKQSENTQLGFASSTAVFQTPHYISAYIRRTRTLTHRLWLFHSQATKKLPQRFICKCCHIIHAHIGHS